MKHLNHKYRGLDALDISILRALVANARVSVAEIARQVGLTSPSVAERVKRLEESGVITGYHAAISPVAIGLPLSGWLRVRPVPGQMERVAEIIRGIPEIVEWRHG